MGIFTAKAANNFAERLDYDAHRFEQALRSQKLTLPANTEVKIPGGALVTDAQGRVIDVYTDSTTRVYSRNKH
jgi:hypothetical protein